MITFLPLGGANEIGANCYYLNINGTGIILDCGMHPKKTGLDALPRFDLLEDKPTDYVLISHAHQDHLNSLPFLIKKFPHLKIVTTPQTRAIAELTLHNAISILGRQINDESFKMYSHEEVDLLIRSIDYKSYGEEFEIASTKVKAEFFNAGHVLGSAGIKIKSGDQSLFYTGDINLSSQTILNGAVLPESQVNTLILECTYGATDSNLLNKWENEVDNFISSLNRILNNGGSVLVPVFSLGKTQELLAVIHHQIKKGTLTRAEIYTGGIGTKLSRIYDYNRYVVDVKDPELILHDIPQKNIYEINNTEELFKFPSIVLASSGMMVETTLSYTLAKRWLRQKNSAIVTVGYMDEDTSGYRVANTRKGDILKLSNEEKEIEVKCEIMNFRFSAHSKREEIIDIVKRLKPENVVLVHGDSEAINWVGASIIRQNKEIKVHSATVGKKISFA